MDKTIKESFREKTGLDWQWKAGKSSAGYGLMWIGKKLEYAHRISYIIHNGKISPGMHVLHSCDDPGCVNPEHLHLGTNEDNIREKVERGRSVNQVYYGEENPKAKFTNKQIIDIRKRYKNGTRQCVFVKEYGVSRTTISDIVNRKIWKHI